MAKEHAVATNGHGSGGHVHHLSAAPIVVAIGALITYIGLASGLGALVHGAFTVGGGLILVGAVVFLAGIGIWLREDVQMWNEHYVDHGVLPGRDLGWWGMVFFLGTEIVLFGGLFAAFFVTRNDAQDVWVRARESLSGALPLVTINTLILISSGVTYHFIGLAGVKKNNRKMFLGGMAISLLLGLTFLIIQMTEYSHLIREGIILNSGDNAQFGSVFYILTGTHAFHVFLGLVFMGIVIWRGLKGQFDPERHVAVDAFAIYWHFVDVVWIGLYFIVYVGVV